MGANALHRGALAGGDQGIGGGVDLGFSDAFGGGGADKAKIRTFGS